MSADTETTVARVADFEVTGAGDAPAWQRAEWLPLTRVNGGAPYATRAKLLYSDTGIYALVNSADARLTNTLAADNTDLFKEDVVEVFLWPDETQPLYFEYELSPLDYELPLLIPNHEGRFVGWLPGWYQGERRCRHATRVHGGPKAAGAAVSGWTAEMFMPYALLPFSARNPPRPGMRWRANIYRIDYDAGTPTQWAWAPATGDDFHAYREFGALIFL